MAEKTRLSKLRLLTFSWAFVTVLVIAWWISSHDTYKLVSSLNINDGQYPFTETAQHYTAVNENRQHLSRPFLNVHGKPQDQQLVHGSRPDYLGHLLPTLPQNVISGVKKFLFFVGYPRSGHSIIGSILDAHPNVVIAHEYNLFEKLPLVIARNSTRGQTNFTAEAAKELFNQLYQNSYENVFLNGTRSENKKGYNLTLNGTWQGSYKDQVLVIGDKYGGGSANLYAQNSTEFKRIYNILLEMIQIPVVIIHCVRNPFDIISTRLLVRVQFHQDQKYPVTESFAESKNRTAKFRNNTLLLKSIISTFKQADSVSRMTNSVFNKSMVLEVHNHELVSDPEKTMYKLCHHLGIVCSPNYVRSCARKVFPKVSRTRFAVDWPEVWKLMVERRKNVYPFFKRYSFNSSI